MKEFIYILAKNNIEKVLIKDYFDKLIPFAINTISKDIFEEAVHLCFKLNYFQNINDCIDIKFAERHCRKLVTFDNDFEKFREHTNLEIEILK